MPRPKWTDRSSTQHWTVHSSMLTRTCGGPQHKLSVNWTQQLDKKTTADIQTDRKTYFMVDLKKCRMCLSDVKWLRLQKSSADTDNNLLVGAAWHRPEWHTTPRWNFTPLSSRKILTTFNAKLQWKAVTHAQFLNEKYSILISLSSIWITKETDCPIC